MAGGPVLLRVAPARRAGEVYKGANALRFGGYTLGGAINYVSKTGYDAPLIELRSEAGSFGFFKNYVGTGQVYGPFDLYVGVSDTELDGFRRHGEQLRRRAFASFGYRLSGGTTVRLDLGFVRSEENLPGALTQPEMDKNPRQRNPVNAPFKEGRDYDYGRGALTVRTPLGERTRCSSGTLSSIIRISITRCRSPSSTTRPTATAPSCATC